ncbi:hypothetical protein [Tenacibaculum aiptasiae]|uniref:hypothetical protein n=1 Tax=Tenacibaculum aiptasiae TaxID=426481 RepID=UPI0023300943|nr:hypothetical protein [Tenacibaculum aiptasiae]
MKKVLTLLIVMSCVFSSFATSPQVPDYLIYKNDTILTYNLLVEQYLQKRKKDKGKLFSLSFRNSVDGFGGSSFNCWRGYQAVYKIENDSLFVDAIINCYSLEDKTEAPKNYITKVFGNKVKQGRVFIDWFSGDISYPLKSKNNKMLRWDGVFEKIYLFEKIIKVKEGRILEIKDQQNYEDLKKGVDRKVKDSISNLLFNDIKKYKWTKNLDECDCSELYTVEIGKNGKITDVVMTNYQTKELIKEFWDRRVYKYCIKSMKKSLSKLQFDIIKRKGKPIEERIKIRIWFNDDGTIERFEY